MRRDQQTLIIMVKRPRTGRVKTRLARDIGDVSATWFYRHTSKAVVSRLSRERLWQTILAVAPDASVCDPIWPRGVTCVPQGHGDLGERMLRVINRVQLGSVVLIGTDIPAIRPVHIAAAFRGLGSHDAVFGPANDGGYWMIGLARRGKKTDVFRGVRWSSNHALSDTLDNLAGHSVLLLDTLSDVDTRIEFQESAGWFGRRVLPTLVR